MKTKIHLTITQLLVVVFMIITSSAALSRANTSSGAQTTKANPFDGIINRTLHIDKQLTFEDWYPMFEVNFVNLKNYEPVQTEGSSIIEIYNMTKGKSLKFIPSWMMYNTDAEPYMSEAYGQEFYPMSYIAVLVGKEVIVNGDLLRIKFKIPNDAQYDSPVFELYATYYQDYDNLGGPEIKWY